MNNQKTGIASLEKLLNYYGIEYTMHGNTYPLNITNMNILGVQFDNVSAWDVDMFHEFVDYLTCLIEDEGMTIKELKKELIT